MTHASRGQKLGRSPSALAHHSPDFPTPRARQSTTGSGSSSSEVGVEAALPLWKVRVRMEHAEGLPQQWVGGEGVGERGRERGSEGRWVVVKRLGGYPKQRERAADTSDIDLPSMATTLLVSQPTRVVSEREREVSMAQAQAKQAAHGCR